MPLNPEFVPIGYDIIGSAFEVMKVAGKGLKEKYYEMALTYELIQKGHEVKCQVEIPAIYKGIEIGNSFVADMIIDNKVLVELKAINYLTEAESRQIITYLKLSGLKLGYLINFGAKDFKVGKTDHQYPYKQGIYRYVNGIED